MLETRHEQRDQHRHQAAARQRHHQQPEPAGAVGEAGRRSGAAGPAYEVGADLRRETMPRPLTAKIALNCRGEAP